MRLVGIHITGKKKWDKSLKSMMIHQVCVGFFYNKYGGFFVFERVMCVAAAMFPNVHSLVHLVSNDTHLYKIKK